LNVQIGNKVMLSPGRGGYAVTLRTTTNLPPTATWTYRLNTGSWRALPATRTIQVPINASLGTYRYIHSTEVQGQVTVADLDYWVPATSTFTTAQATTLIALPLPNNTANVIENDYKNGANVEGSGFAAVNFGGVGSRNGWLYVGWRKYYERLAVSLKLDPGYFGPADDPAWGLQSISWTPTPNQSAGIVAFYEVEFNANGLCWLKSDPATVVDPNVGFPISVNGKDAIGQPFNATGRLIPTNVEYHRSISTIQTPRIPEWEWPMQFIVRERVVDVVLDGVVVKLVESILQIGDLEVELQDAYK
jgi:hypothetical protein